MPKEIHNRTPSSVLDTSFTENCLENERCHRRRDGNFHTVLALCQHSVPVQHWHHRFLSFRFSTSSHHNRLHGSLQLRTVPLLLGPRTQGKAPHVVDWLVEDERKKERRKKKSNMSKSSSTLESRAVTRDVFSATIGSVCCCYVGQPFDTGAFLGAGFQHHTMI